MHSGNKNTGLQSVICNSGVQNTLANYFFVRLFTCRLEANPLCCKGDRQPHLPWAGGTLRLRPGCSGCLSARLLWELGELGTQREV